MRPGSQRASLPDVLAHRPTAPPGAPEGQCARAGRKPTVEAMTSDEKPSPHHHPAPTRHGTPRQPDPPSAAGSRLNWLLILGLGLLALARPLTNIVLDQLEIDLGPVVRSEEHTSELQSRGHL